MTAKDNRWNEETLSENPTVELLEALGYEYLSSEEIEFLRECLVLDHKGTRISLAIKLIN